MAASIRSCLLQFRLGKCFIRQNNLPKIRGNSEWNVQGRRHDLPGAHQIAPLRLFSTTGQKWDLNEFFDDSKNWTEDNVKVGRAWRIDELRIKSNSDLHKLWYVLLKEKNMLLTMEQAYTSELELMPNPERLDKVEESMENLEDVVRERNKAYYELETAETGEAPTVDQITPMGKMRNREIKEYVIPKHMNKKWQDEQIVIDPKELKMFNRRLREYANLQSRRKRNQDERYVKNLLKRFPDLDEEALKDQYPDIDIERMKSYVSK